MKNFREVNEENYVSFYTMDELVFSLKRNVKVWSWGAANFINDRKKFLKFHVNGHLFKGQVIIAVNGSDLFDVFLTKASGEIIHEMNDIFIGDLIDSIDEKVEKIPGYRF